MSPELRLETRLIHAVEHERGPGVPAVPPIHQCTVFGLDERDPTASIRYPRLSNLPEHRLLGAKLAALEGGQAGLVTASGMAAIAASLLTLLADGGHALVQDGVYGGTHGLFLHDLPDFGMGCCFIDDADPASWRAALTPRTRVIYTEAISNPLMRVIDHRAVVAFAREHGLTAVIDNTFTSPVLFRPLELGYDLVVHSATKYLNGHSDLVAGALVGPAELVERIQRRLDHLGGSLDPHACYLLQRGLKTLALRVRQQSASALAVARHLAAHPAVTRVHYPGLPEHPGHAVAGELFDGFGGMLAFEPAGGGAAAARLVARTRLFLHAPSLGGPESLLTLPATTSHRGLEPAERERLGISEALVRTSIGLEHPDDLIADLDQSLAG